MVFTVSCTEKIELPLDTTEPYLVVNAIITTDTAEHIVQLYKTADFYNSEVPEPISNAQVTLMARDRTILLAEDPACRGTYATSPEFYGEIGQTYILQIEQVDINNDGIMETYSAENTIAPINQIDSIKVEAFEAGEHTGVHVIVFYPDPPGPNYYLFKTYINDVLISDSLHEWQIANDLLFDGGYVNGLPWQWLDADDKEDERLFAGDTVMFEMNSIDKGYFDYIAQMYAEISHNPLMSGPPANIVPNISGRAVGYFACYSVSRKCIVLKNDLLQ